MRVEREDMVSVERGGEEDGGFGKAGWGGIEGGAWRARVGGRLGRWMHGLGGRVVLLKALPTVAWLGLFD